MRGQPTEPSVAALCVALMLSGCSSSPRASDLTPDPEPPATAAERSGAPDHITRLLGSVDWADEASSIHTLFAALPDTLAGLELTARLPGPEPAASAEAMDGFVVRYGTAGSGSTIELTADPGAGIRSPVHGMASTVVNSGGPERCVDVDHSPLLDGLFQLQDSDDLQRELRRIAEAEPVLGELVWLVCTMTVDGDRDVPLERADWRHVAYWADGGWLYSVRADSAALRDVAIATLSALAAPGQATGPALPSGAGSWDPGAPASVAPSVLSTSTADARRYREYRVTRGDTLWAIASAELGDPFRWPEIASASGGTTQPDGDRLTDPDLIRTGWILRIPGTALVSVAAGGGYTCALDRAGQAWCWGSDGFGTLGDGGPADAGADVGSASPVAVSEGHTFTSISAGNSHACALDMAGRAWCWGWEEEGALGDGPPEEETEPNPVAVAGDQRFTTISAGWSGSCALDDTGRAWCWGTDQGLAPMAIAGPRTFTQISAGDRTCAVDDTGGVWSWGLDQGVVPVAVATERTFTRISGGHVTCALDADGSAWCGGSGGSKLGALRAVPGRHEFAEISVGGGHACALDPAGRAWCWGWDRDGQLGDGRAADETTRTPVAVVDGHSFTAISAGTSHTCALDRSGTAWCWGEAAALGAGNPTAPDEAHPVPVRFQ